jgi:ribosomal protein S18 acetylase RimI-like enzyme
MVLPSLDFDNHRDQGIGKRLMEAAVAGAIERRLGSRLTYDFQAPRTVWECGFERIAELTD